MEESSAGELQQLKALTLSLSLVVDFLG
jgi:hypothetical protein